MHLFYYEKLAMNANLNDVDSQATDEDGTLSPASVSYNNLVDITELNQKYADASRETLLETLVKMESSYAAHMTTMRARLSACDEQNRQLQRDMIGLQSEFKYVKSHFSTKISELEKSRDDFRALATLHETENVYLEDHARFCAEQTRLTASHWELIVKNRDENIEMLNVRLRRAQSGGTPPSGKRGGGGDASEEYMCLVDRHNSLLRDNRLLEKKFAALREHMLAQGVSCELPTALSSGSVGEVAAACPFKDQLAVRVGQLERLTSQLNSTFNLLHTKTDEVLTQNNIIGGLRRRVSELQVAKRHLQRRADRLASQLRLSDEALGRGRGRRTRSVGAGPADAPRAGSDSPPADRVMPDLRDETKRLLDEWTQAAVPTPPVVGGGTQKT